MHFPCHDNVCLSETTSSCPHCTSHWVVWTKRQHNTTGVDAMKVTSQVAFCDPFINGPTSTFKNLAYIPTQPNGWECVYYVMQSILMLVEELNHGFGSPDFVSMAHIWKVHLLLSNMFILISKFGTRYRELVWIRRRKPPLDNYGEMDTKGFGLFDFIIYPFL